MDELQLLSLINSFFTQRRNEIEKGIGDDCAVIKIGNDNFLFTVDSMVEEIHFRKEWLSPEEIGIRAMAINLSDIAAMGGEPLYALIALEMGQFNSNEIKEVMKGIASYAEQFHCDVIGGNISSSKEFSLTVTLIGKAKKPVYRSGAKGNELICVTGTIGDAALGVELLKKGEKTNSHSVQKFISPYPRIKEGQIIAQFASSMIDISDGLLLDLWRILNASSIGGKIFPEKIPRSEEFVSQKVDMQNPIYWGGEDYELLFTINEENFQKLLEEYKFDIPVTPIGETIKEKGLFLEINGEKRNIAPSGWIHK